MSLARDAESARSWIVGIGATCLRNAEHHNEAQTVLLDRVNVLATCAELPDEMVVRLRCFPNVWNLRA